MFMALWWLLQAKGFWVCWCLSEAQPRQASDWNGGDDRMKGEWAWEWAACVPSG